MSTAVITRPNRVLDVGLAVAVVALGIGAYAASGSPKAAAATPRTTAVARGVVSTSVQASGNVQAGQSYSVGFQTGGQVIDINAKVGDVVTKGQELAHLDPTMDTASLASAQAGLVSAQAHLAQVEQVLTPAQRVQAAASLTSAQAQVDSAKSGVDAAQNTAAIDATQAQQAVDDARSKLDDDTAANASATVISQDQSALTQAQNALANGTNKDQQSITAAQNQLTQATDQLNATVATNAASQQLQPSDLAAAQATLAQAQAQAMSAEQTMGWTTLQAPADGVVTAVNGVVGQTVSGGGVSATAGSTTSGASSGSTSTSSSSASSSSSSTSSAFMTITNVDALSVKAGFAETDATKLQVGQPAAVSFSALPSVQAAGMVTSVDLSSTLVSNVVTYFATVTLTRVPAGVKPGMTASVTVTINRREGVLNVPSAAVRGTGSAGTVTVVSGKVETTKTVGVGLRGDTTTEITSGLNVGDTVVLPSSTLNGVSSQLGATRVGGALTGGGLGGGVGGGVGGGGVRTGVGTGGARGGG
jgi:multidrug efflux pump subunit AcrA (membrane-fusion protein)